MATKRTGLSAEEKRKKLLELFHETAEIYQLKDLERIAPKEKGIVQQSVKTTLQELVDNGDVSTDKVAGSLFYWAFPNQILNALEQQLEEAEKTDFKLQVKLEAFKKQLNVTTTELGDMEAVEKLEEELKFLQKERDDLKVRVSQMVDYDAAAKKQRDSKLILEAANRWTNNIFLTKGWVKNNFNKDENVLNKAFGIPDDLDFLDEDV